MAYSTAWTDALQIIADTYNTSVANVESVLNGYDIYDDPVAALTHFRDTRYLAEMEKFNHVAANGSVQGQYLTGVGSTSTITNNSNTILRSQIRTPINSKIEIPAGGTTAKFSAKVGLREAGTFVFGEVVPAICAAGWGITLGKTIDRLLYNASPDFWDAHGMSSLNPETWNSITSGYDGVAGTLFNLIFGLNGDKAQAYMDEDAAAYIAYWMLQQGIFDTGGGYGATYTPTPEQTIINNIVQPVNFDYGTRIFSHKLNTQYGYVMQTDTPVIMTCAYSTALNSGLLIALSDQPFKAGYTWNNIETANPSPTTNATQRTTLNNTPYYRYYTVISDSEIGASNMPYTGYTSLSESNVDKAVATIIFDGTVEKKGGVEGIGDQDGATQPDTSDWSDLNSTKNSLQRQYPDLWNNAKHNDYVDDDGNNKHKTYIPINLPNITSANDTQPTSGDRSQSDPEVDPATATDTLLDNLPKIITSQPTSGSPTPTGSGSTPDVLPPTGSASSLWAVYNPTQAQVNAFGSWLWSSNLVEQIKKLFNDPMQAIIGIHKVFVTPPTSGTGTIKCGYIDSGVSSALVSNQYTTINCGTVSLSEYFGNVFDYSPFTEVSLYLPFIGIVRLDVSDVMRSSINIKYHVDVITGACLADVKVSRDGANSVLYQYAGSCIVTYPLSSGSYASALAGIVSIAGGAIGTIATGGALAPVAIGAAVGATKLHSDVQKSGSLTGAAGAMGSKKPYLIISRPQTALPSNYKKYEGNPSRHYTTIRSCSGFIRVKDVHVDKMSASNKELDMIESLLKSGIEV